MGVLHHIKVKSLIEDKFERMFKQKPDPDWNLTHVVSTIIMAAIAVNLLVFFGSTGERWRRVFLMPWLNYYGSNCRESPGVFWQYRGTLASCLPNALANLL